MPLRGVRRGLGHRDGERSCGACALGPHGGCVATPLGPLPHAHSAVLPAADPDVRHVRGHRRKDRPGLQHIHHGLAGDNEAHDDPGIGARTRSLAQQRAHCGRRNPVARTGRPPEHLGRRGLSGARELIPAPGWPPGQPGWHHPAPSRLRCGRGKAPPLSGLPPGAALETAGHWLVSRLLGSAEAGSRKSSAAPCPGWGGLCHGDCSVANRREQCDPCPVGFAP
mmetsp:Transcript_102983/g.229958  ORF Transcript_102983/g.229958 Transcript_102983/m.229958 type:complete len:224 (+) Transcript_102983:1147-1818(+)